MEASQTHLSPEPSCTLKSVAPHPFTAETDAVEVVRLDWPAFESKPRLLENTTAATAIRASLLAARTTEERLAFVKSAYSHSQLIRSIVQRVSHVDPQQQKVLSLYQALKDQIVGDGRVRTVGARELVEMLKDGCVQRGKDFALQGQGARLGHNGRFICIACDKSSSARFHSGGLGSSEINFDRIPLEDITVFVPRLTKQMLASVLED